MSRSAAGQKRVFNPHPYPIHGLPPGFKSAVQSRILPWLAWHWLLLFSWLKVSTACLTRKCKFRPAASTEANSSLWGLVSGIFFLHYRQYRYHHLVPYRGSGAFVPSKCLSPVGLSCSPVSCVPQSKYGMFTKDENRVMKVTPPQATYIGTSDTLSFARYWRRSTHPASGVALRPILALLNPMGSILTIPTT